MKNSYPQSSEEGVSNLCWSGLEKLFGIGKEVWDKPFQGGLMGCTGGRCSMGKDLELGMYTVCARVMSRV